MPDLPHRTPPALTAELAARLADGTRHASVHVDGVTWTAEYHPERERMVRLLYSDIGRRSGGAASFTLGEIAGTEIGGVVARHRGGGR